MPETCFCGAPLDAFHDRPSMAGWLLCTAEDAERHYHLPQTPAGAADALVAIERAQSAGHQVDGVELRIMWLRSLLARRDEGDGG